MVYILQIASKHFGLDLINFKKISVHIFIYSLSKTTLVTIIEVSPGICYMYTYKQIFLYILQKQTRQLARKCSADKKNTNNAFSSLRAVNLAKVQANTGQPAGG